MGCAGQVSYELFGSHMPESGLSPENARSNDEGGVLDSMLSNPFFSDLEPKMVAELAERSEMHDFVPGEYLLREGETGDAAYVIQAGTAAVSMVVQGKAVEVAERQDV